MKNTPKIILIAFMLLGIIVSPVSAEFPDVSSDHIYSDAISYVQEEGIVDGFSDGTFGPEKTITRAEFTKIIVNAKFSIKSIGDCLFDHYHAGVDMSPFDNVYPDVKGGATAQCYLLEDPNSCLPEILERSSKFGSYVCMAKENAILGGYSDGTFRPDNLITVGEASKIISNAYGFTDLDSGPEGDIFEPFVSALAGKNAIPTSIISIDSELKRGEMAEIIYRLENNIIDKETRVYTELYRYAGWATFKSKDETVSFRYKTNMEIYELAGNTFNILFMDSDPGTRFLINRNATNPINIFIDAREGRDIFFLTPDDNDVPHLKEQSYGADVLKVFTPIFYDDNTPTCSKLYYLVVELNEEYTGLLELFYSNIDCNNTDYFEPQTSEIESILDLVDSFQIN